jgi:hypothetical protein
MVICSCRDIRDSQYTNREELRARILEDDFCCGTCQDEFLVDGGDIGIRFSCNRNTETD